MLSLFFASDLDYGYYASGLKCATIAADCLCCCDSRLWYTLMLQQTCILRCYFAATADFNTMLWHKALIRCCDSRLQCDAVTQGFNTLGAADRTCRGSAWAGRSSPRGLVPTREPYLLFFYGHNHSADPHERLKSLRSHGAKVVMAP